MSKIIMTSSPSFLFLWLVSSFLLLSLQAHADGEDCIEIDAALNYRGTIYLFHGDEYLKLDDDFTESRTGSISRFGGLKGRVNAALEWTDKKRKSTYFFKGDDYFRYSMLIVGPYAARNVDAAIADGIDAAGTCNGLSYFFKDCSIVRIDMKDKETSETLHADDVGLPCHVDAAFTTDDVLYVIKGDEVWSWGSQLSGPFPLSEVITLNSWNVCSADE